MALLFVLFGLFCAALAVVVAIGLIQLLREHRGVRVRYMLVWPVLAAALYFLAEANLGDGAGVKGAAVAGVAMFACLYRPGFRQWKVDMMLALVGWAALATLAGICLILLSFIRDHHLNVVATVRAVWPVMLGTAVAYATARGLDRYVSWSMCYERKRCGLDLEPEDA